MDKCNDLSNISLQRDKGLKPYKHKLIHALQILFTVFTVRKHLGLSRVLTLGPILETVISYQI